MATASLIAAQELATTTDDSRQGTPTIAGAKKEFESIKSSREAALLPDSGMPRVSLPALPPVQGLGTPATSAKKMNPDSMKATTGNWLVEAMEKQNDRGDLRRDKSAQRDRGGKPRTETDDAKELETRDVARGGQGSKEGEISTVVNPLMRYLDDWMTPQDYALLKPGLMQQFDPRVDANNATVSNLGAAGLPGGLSEFALGGLVAPSQVRELPKENPYLQSLNSEAGIPASAVVSQPSFVPQVQPPAAPRIVPPSALPPTAPARIPDFAKPGTDEKYFKPLKRF